MFHRIIEDNRILKLYLNKDRKDNINFLLLIEEIKQSNTMSRIYCFNFTDKFIIVLLHGKELYKLTLFPYNINQRPRVEVVTKNITINLGIVGVLGNETAKISCNSELYNVASELCKLLYIKAQTLRKYVRAKYGIDPKTKSILNYGRIVPSYKIYIELSKNKELLEKLREYELSRNNANTRESNNI